MKISKEDMEELEKEIEKSVFIQEELFNSGLDFESSEKLAWGDINKLNYYTGEL